MRKGIRLPHIAVLLALLAALAGCISPPPAGTEPIDALVSAQQDAIRAADVDAALGTVNPDDAWYRTEMANLVRDQAVAPVEDYTRTVKNIRQIDDATWEATLTQRYTAGGESRSSQCVHRFIAIGNRIYDAGPAFPQYRDGKVTVYHTADTREMARELSAAVNVYLAELEAAWGFMPKEGLHIKLYDDHEVFLQSIKLTLPAWVGGWHESGESIKLFAAMRRADAYAPMLRHETTHMALSELTGDNAAYWMHEGFATLLEQTGTAALTSPYIADMDALEGLYRQKRLPDITDHLSANPELLSDSLDVRGYYAYSCAMVVWLLDERSPDILKPVFEALRACDMIPGTAAEKIEALNERTAAALRSAAQIEFGEDFEDWLEQKIIAFTNS
jgi:hypothetical protein